MRLTYSKITMPLNIDTIRASRVSNLTNWKCVERSEILYFDLEFVRSMDTMRGRYLINLHD